MRLIDADAMEKQAYDDLHYQATIENWEFDLITHYIDHAPTIDAVPVCRCKDCKWFADNNGGEWYGCWLFNGIFHGQSDIPTSDDFCSYGERKDGDCDAN